MKQYGVFVTACAAVLFSSAAQAQVFHDEAVHGDLSDNRLAPTAYTLPAGTGSLRATTGAPDLEYVALTIPTGNKLAGITLVSYEGLDITAFIGVQAGSVFTEPPATPNVANILGYAHYGPAFVGTDILDDMGQGFLSIGFTPPLASGTYTFWLQQLGLACTYQFDFKVTGCYPDCNTSGSLTIADFGCFQAAFSSGNMYADCNGSGTLTIADFGCFQASFAAGCP
jgi:hypothetical protein